MKTQSPLYGSRFIVTGGPTREYLDPVRFISNASSGKMGAALALAAAEYTDDIVFIHGPVDSSIISELPFRKIHVTTNAEMLNAVQENLKDNTVLIMAAAPADFLPVTRSNNKIKKVPGKVSFDFVQNVDILKSVGEFINGNALKDVFRCGFAAETENFVENATNKIRNKKLDMICLNDVTEKGSGFDSDTNRVTVITVEGNVIEIPMSEKKIVATEILLIIEKMRGTVYE